MNCHATSTADDSAAKKAAAATPPADGGAAAADAPGPAAAANTNAAAAPNAANNNVAAKKAAAATPPADGGAAAADAPGPAAAANTTAAAAPNAANNNVAAAETDSADAASALTGLAAADPTEMVARSKETNGLRFAPFQVHPCVLPLLVGYSRQGMPGALSGSNNTTPNAALAKNFMKSGLTGKTIHDTHMHATFARKVELFGEWNKPTHKEKKEALDAKNSWVSRKLGKFPINSQILCMWDYVRGLPPVEVVEVGKFPYPRSICLWASCVGLYAFDAYGLIIY